MPSMLKRFLTKSIDRLRMSKTADVNDIDQESASQVQNGTPGTPSGTRFILGGLGESRQLYALTKDWQVESHRRVDLANAKGIVIAADPALDLARRIDHTASERVQLAEFASDVGEVLLAVKTKARSGLTQLLSRKARSSSDDDGETLSAAQAIQERGWWLCTSVNRLQELEPSVRVLPLTAVFLKLLEAHSQEHAQIMDSGPTVVALVFPGAARVEDYQIVCLATFTAAGHLEGLDFVPGSGMSVEQVISNYVAERRLDSEGLWPQERLVLATTADPQVKKWLASAAPYPRQQLIMGMPVKKASSLATRASVVALTATVSYSAFAHLQLSQLHADLAQAQADQKQARTRAIAAVRERSLGYVLSQSTLDTQRAIDLAVQAWQPGTSVEMQATRERVTLTVTAALGQGEATLVNAPSPEGCTKGPTQVNASMNQLVVTYECTLQNTELERMRVAGF